MIDNPIIIIYFAPAFISLIVLGFMNKKLIWLSIIITIIADLIAFWDELLYYESRPLLLIFLIPQILVVGTISLIVMLIHRKKGQRSK